ncbi:hypothetical protein V8G54_030322 [Vigna mungo]|uniref:Uncharacterized protein n=1 Tax=Vigna mungo TaxID=3915 RepID=A0AAQ3RL68_VIGMU
MMRQCLSGIDTYNILDRYCKADSTKKHEGPWIRSLTQKFESSLNSPLRVRHKMSSNYCKYRYFLATQWANDETVCKSLHIRERLNSSDVGEQFITCNWWREWRGWRWATSRRPCRRQSPKFLGTKGKWERCWTGDFEYEISSSFAFHVNLSAKGYRSLIYRMFGVLLAVVPFMSTQTWIRALNYSIVERQYLIQRK